MRLISVVLGAKSENARARESQKLLNYGFRFFESHRLYGPNEALTTVKIWKGESESLPLGLAEEMVITIPRGQYDNLNAAMKVSPLITAPIIKGNNYGHIEVSINGEVIATKPLVALQNIAEGGFFSRMIDEGMMLLE
jgi:D-alanyl-D-alanine carboxypeptidase (penicillin-binding protein 5/6)